MRVHGNLARPRLSVHVSNRQITAQIVDDEAGKTLAYASSLKSKVGGTMTDKAALVGEQIAEAAKKAKIKKVVFDRGARRYHGRIEKLAESARAGGLEF